MVMFRETTAPLGADDPLQPVFAHTRDLGEKDLALAMEMGSDVGMELPVTHAAYQCLAEYLGVAHEEDR